MADTLVSEIVIQAFREGNFIAVGETTTAEELLEAVPRVNNLIASLLGIELGEAYRDFYVPQEHDPAAPLRHPLTPTGQGLTSEEPWQFPPANSRLLVKVDEERVLYFPANPLDGSRMMYLDMGCEADVTLNGNGRLIEGEPEIETVLEPEGEADPVLFHRKKWLYRADMGDWIELKQPLLAGDTVPLPPEFDDLLVTGLAMRLAPRFQVQVDAIIAERFTDMLARLKKRYKQSERMPTSMELRQTFREI